MRVKQFKDVVQLGVGYVAVMVFVDLLYYSHNFSKFVVIVYSQDEFLSRNRSEFAQLLPVELGLS
jgi:hypothetical protein